MLILSWQYIRAFVIIYSCLLLGNFLTKFMPIAVPGSILGMLLLFLMLSLNIVPPQWIKPGCMLLIRYMAVLFVPIGVGIMNYYEPISERLGPIAISCAVSTLITMLVVGLSAQFAYRQKP